MNKVKTAEIARIRSEIWGVNRRGRRVTQRKTG